MAFFLFATDEKATHKADDGSGTARMKERMKVATSFSTDEKAKGKSDSGTASMDVAVGADDC